MNAKLLETMQMCDLRDVYVDTMLRLMADDERIVQLEADLAGALKTRVIGKEFPKRYYNCGIMEAQMVGLGCGMSVNGMIPFAHSFAAFLSRRVADQVYMSGCYANANLKLVASDPGIFARDNGGTHMAFEDIGIMRSMAGMTILDIGDAVQLEKLLPVIASTYGMTYMRLPRSATMNYYDPENIFEIGRAKRLRKGEDATIIASGAMVPEALQAAEILAAEGTSVDVVDMFTIKPIDVEMIVECAERTGAIVTVDNHNINGGLGSAVAEVLVEHAPVPMRRVGVMDVKGEVGDTQYLLNRFGLKANHIVEACRGVISRK